MAVLAVFQAFPDLFLWDREQILAGQVWRLITGHWVHLSVWHFVFNALASAILMLWVGPNFKFLVFSVEVVCLSFGLSVWLFLIPGLSGYGGLSGVLHGIFCLYALRLLYFKRDIWWGGVYLLIFVKIVFEQAVGGSGLMLVSADFPVITEAHLFGFLLGTLLALAQVLRAILRVRDLERVTNQ